MLEKMKEQHCLIRSGYKPAILLVEEKVDVVLVGNLEEGAFHVLINSLVHIYYLSKAVEIREVVHLLNQNLLEKMASPTGKCKDKKSELQINLVYLPLGLQILKGVTAYFLRQFFSMYHMAALVYFINTIY